MEKAGILRKAFYNKQSKEKGYGPQADEEKSEDAGWQSLLKKRAF